MQVALEGCKDYGLLVIIPQDSFEELARRFTESFGYNLKVIVHIFEGGVISFKQDSKSAEIIGILSFGQIIEFVAAFFPQRARSIVISRGFYIMPNST